MKDSVYKKVSVESAVSGWVLKVPKKPPEIFVRWESLVMRLEEELASRRGATE